MKRMLNPVVQLCQHLIRNRNAPFDAHQRDRIALVTKGGQVVNQFEEDIACLIDRKLPAGNRNVIAR